MTIAIALAQVNPTVGDVRGNLALIRKSRDAAAADGADLVAFPELVLVGYPPEDLVLRPSFVRAARSAFDELVAESAQSGPALLVTLPWDESGRLYNAVALIAHGQHDVRFKVELPNYGVFDEKRVFAVGPPPLPFTLGPHRIGAPICEDMWFPAVPRALADAGAQLLIVPNGSPFEVDKFDQRLALARQRVSETRLPLVYVNQVGGQDELVFDGGSFVLNADGSMARMLPRWEEATSTTTWTFRDCGAVADDVTEWTGDCRLESMYQAMMLGLRDYLRKNGFPGVVLGLSGGIDSALTAAVAVDALGPHRVRGVRLPSRFTTASSQDDAAETQRLLGLRLDTIEIEPVVAAVERVVQPLFEGKPRDVTEENIQARGRGLLLMALSNKFGDLLLTTGNKSEMSVGYATLYGDMCGGFSVLKDIYKTDVYRLSRWRNAQRPRGALGPVGHAIPESSITKAPTAELRPNQTDQDSLPPYEELDAVLHGLVEEEESVEVLLGRGFDRATVERIQRLLFAAEYKRRQAPPGVKITRRSFGRDRRYPLTNAFRG